MKNIPSTVIYNKKAVIVIYPLNLIVQNTHLYLNFGNYLNQISYKHDENNKNPHFLLNPDVKNLIKKRYFLIQF